MSSLLSYINRSSCYHVSKSIFQKYIFINYRVCDASPTSVWEAGLVNVGQWATVYLGLAPPPFGLSGFLVTDYNTQHSSLDPTYFNFFIHSCTLNPSFIYNRPRGHNLMIQDPYEVQLSSSPNNITTYT